MLYAAQRQVYLVDVDNHINLERENVVKLDILFTIENLKCLADADSTTQHEGRLPSRSCRNSNQQYIALQ